MEKIRKLWTYKPDDKSTWKYLDCSISGEYRGTRRVKHWILNPDFAYRHLDPADGNDDE